MNLETWLTEDAIRDGGVEDGEEQDVSLQSNQKEARKLWIEAFYLNITFNIIEMGETRRSVLQLQRPMFFVLSQQDSASLSQGMPITTVYNYFTLLVQSAVPMNQKWTHLEAKHRNEQRKASRLKQKRKDRDLPRAP